MAHSGQSRPDARRLIFDRNTLGEDFLLTDNTGRTWPFTGGQKDALVLPPGETQDDLEVTFDGQWLTDPQVHELTLTTRGLLGLPHARWSIPVNVVPAHPTTSINTAPGTILTVGQPWHYGDLIFNLDRVEISANEIKTEFYIVNGTNSPLIFDDATVSKSFHVTDDHGREWPITGGPPPGPILLQPGATTEDIGPSFGGQFVSDPKVLTASLRVDSLFGSPPAQWKIDVTH